MEKIRLVKAAEKCWPTTRRAPPRCGSSSRTPMTQGPRGSSSALTAAPTAPTRCSARRSRNGRAPPCSPTMTPPSPTTTSPASPASAAARRPPRTASKICCSEHTYDGIIVDTQAVQRHRVSILECVKDADAPIRKRALELVYLLVNDTNVKLLTKKLVDYLKVANPDFKEDLRAKICSMAEKFSQEKLWYLDQMFKVLSLSWHMLKETL
ncbi:uncharacterized protein LOC123443548 isoform X2 [Hordeum vulgare subsp. vulgare]|uniref:uncharacterized protein LOC123443548 isoform X2 n=1 Tax=Hordeum vulgare subsp. vulgare TaxID=112509 RepID=UPI001D1A4131|nr:uncharacterized protein LOC123443548 isoform X2 [Hordeum vulgare subsp. vulgare]